MNAGSAALSAVLLLAPLQALAQEKEDPAPWRVLYGRNVGAVGTCPTEAGEPSGCFMVRCDRARGLVFVVQDEFVESFGVESYRFTFGKAAFVVAIEKAGKDEAVITLGPQPKLHAALKGKTKFAYMFTVKAANSYSTGFELTDARRLIESIEKSCRAG